MERYRQLTLDQDLFDSKKPDRVAEAIEQHKPLIDTVVNAVAGYYSISVEDMLGPSRKPDLVEARFLAAHLMHMNSELGQKAIAFALGRTDHTTTIHALRRAGQLITGDPYFRERVEAVSNQVFPLE